MRAPSYLRRQIVLEVTRPQRFPITQRKRTEVWVVQPSPADRRGFRACSDKFPSRFHSDKLAEHRAKSSLSSSQSREPQSAPQSSSSESSGGSHALFFPSFTVFMASTPRSCVSSPMFLTLAAVRTKMTFGPRRFLDPGVEALSQEVKIPTA
jgi:hypothetical protein